MYLRRQIGPDEGLEPSTDYEVDDTAGLDATTDADGNLRLFVGTDSGFEGRTSLYDDRTEVVWSAQE